MDIATLSNAPRQVRLGGSTYLIRALTFAEWGLLQGFVKNNGEDPITSMFRTLEKVKRLGIDIDAVAREELIKQAQLEQTMWPPQVMTRQWFGLLSEIPGASVEFLWATLKTNFPGCPYELAREIESRMTLDESNDLIAAAIGIDPPPKASPPKASTGGSKPKRQRSKTTGQRPSTT